MDTTNTILQALNNYDGDDIWADVILPLPTYVKPASAGFTTTSGSTFRRHEGTGAWYLARRPVGSPDRRRSQTG